MTNFLQDLRYGLRMMAKSPGITAIALLSLALGIGANTTIFTLINAVFLRPLPVKDPSQLVSMYGTSTRDGPGGGFGIGFWPTSYPNYLDYRDRNDVLSGLAAFTFLPANLSGNGEPEQIAGLFASGNYFDVIGVQPALGRAFLPEEDNSGGALPVAVISHALWNRRFAADLNIIGKSISLNGREFTVIGVTPPDFRGTNATFRVDLWIPLGMFPEMAQEGFRPLFKHRGVRILNLIGRLKPGIDEPSADASIVVLGTQLEKENPDNNKGRGATLIPLSQSSIDPNQRDTFVLAGSLLMGMVGLVLLIACVNMANLLLARATARQREIAIRLSIGADRWRLIRQLLTESLILGVLGGLLGLCLAIWCRDLLWSFRPPFLPQDALTLPLDARVLGFTTFISIVTGLLFGLAPALAATRTDLVTSLKVDRGTSSSRRRRLPLRNALVIGQVALSLIALAGAGLFLRSLWNAQKTDLGFNAERLVSVFVAPGMQGYDEPHAREYYRRVLETVQAVPGVESAALMESPPLQPNGLLQRVYVEGFESAPGLDGVYVSTNYVTIGALDTIGVPLVKGRKFTDADRAGAPMVAIPNETMARQFWPGVDPIGRRFHFSLGDEHYEVIGIAKDSKYNSLGDTDIPHMYMPLEQKYAPGIGIIARAQGAPLALMETLRKKVQSVDPNLVLTVGGYDQVLRDALWAPRMGASLLGIFGLMALLLAGAGLYGVMAYLVGRQTREIGIRMALGARPRDILRAVLRQGMGLTVVGILLGLTVAWALGRLYAQLLFGVSGADPFVLGSISTMLAAVAVVASYLPARRAMQIDPKVALQQE